MTREQCQKKVQALAKKRYCVMHIQTEWRFNHDLIKNGAQGRSYYIFVELRKEAYVGESASSHCASGSGENWLEAHTQLIKDVKDMIAGSKELASFKIPKAAL